MRGAPSRLRCEYLENPAGIDTPRPRLSWWLNDARPAEMQTAYQIQAASSPTSLDSGCPDFWDSGCVTSQSTVNVEYLGAGVQSGARVWWRVRCYDSDGIASAWSDPARFDFGLLDDDDDDGDWICTPLTGTPLTSVPVPLLFRDFEISGPVRAARLHVAALGSALLEINGRPAGSDEPFGPWVHPQRSVPCRMLDVTGLVVPGANRIGALLADGDYCGALCGGERQRYGLRPALWALLVVDLADGSRLRVASDAAWRWRPSWILRADRDGGEERDGRQQQPDWSCPGRGLPGYAVDVTAVPVRRCAFRVPPVRVAGELLPCRALERRRLGDGRVRIRADFGRSLLGRLRIRLRARAGQTLTVRYGVDSPALADASEGAPGVCWSDEEDRYTAAGGELETFEPRFALHGFRYVEIRSPLEPHDIDGIVALEVASGAPRVAEFRCDHPSLEVLFAAASRTFALGLALGPVAGLAAPRRVAASADAEPILVGAAACLDVAALYRTWVEGLCDELLAEGVLPLELPAPAAGAPPGARDVESLLPCLWFLYRGYGDRRLLEVCYAAVQRYLATARERSPGLIGQGADASSAPEDQLLGTAWYAYGLVLATRMAGVLGRLSDLEAYDALLGRVRKAFRGRFLTRDGLLVADSQLGYLLALELGLLEGDERTMAMSRLEAQLQASAFHPAVDLRYGGLLLEVLTLEGRLDLALQVLLQTTPPGWLAALQSEPSVLADSRWDSPGRLAPGSVAAWLQRFLLGLELDDNLTPELNAYRRMRVEPRPPLGSGFAAGPPVTAASGHLDTVHGRYVCAWHIDGENFHLRVTVPGNCSARVILPDGSEQLVVAGEHAFSLPLDGMVLEAADTADDIPVLQEVTGSR